MRKKIFLGIILIIILGIIGYLIIINVFFNEEIEVTTIDEYTPEVEISDDELRTTIVTLYFVDSDTGSLKSEARFIDSKELLNDPYEKLINMLIDGPKDSSLNSVIPPDTKVLDTELNGNCVTVNFSEEFINNASEDGIQKSNMIYSIVNTLTELKEVESVKFLINGEEVSGFDADGINLTGEFVRKD